MARPSSRERILDALSTVVVRHGVAAATLDAVCAQAQVSKGGLLYHFPSRDALFDGLRERLMASVDEALSEAPTDRDGLVEWYLRIPVIGDTESALYAAFIAAARADASGDLTSTGLAELFDGFFAPLDSLDDPVLRAEVQLAADGLFLRAILGLALPDEQTLASMIERICARR